MRTAERAYCDDEAQKYLFARCIVPYLHIATERPCAGLRVLDAGSGAGAGSEILARSGASVCAVDFSADDVALTVKSCNAVRGVVADVCTLPFADETFDFVVSCHVLEHLRTPELYLAELRRVSRRNADVWVITPNKLFSSPNGPPPNPFHVKEYFSDEFGVLVRSIFPEAEFRGVNHITEGTVGRAERARSRWHSLDALSIRRFLPASVKRLLRSLVGASYPSELKVVEPNDFRITLLEPNLSVDLVAICQRLT
jgi:SAM-dependent methyltransferase